MKRIVRAVVGVGLIVVAVTLALWTSIGLGASPLERADASVVFVCQNGVAMSVWSAARFNQLAEKRGLKARASARAAAQTFTRVPLSMQVALAYDGYAIGAYVPKVVATKDLGHAARVVLIDTELPSSASVRGAEIERWGGFPPMRERYVASRAELRKRVDDLVERIRAESLL